MGGKAVLIKFARDGICERGAFESCGTASEDTTDSASDVSVGDVGNGGTSSNEVDMGGRCELNDAREREKDARREASDDFLLKDFLGLHLSLSSVSLSLAESYSTSSPV